MRPGYFGNEASHTEFYTYAALEIDVPPADQRKVAQPAPSADSAAPPPAALAKSSAAGVQSPATFHGGPPKKTISDFFGKAPPL